jgi:hypothetical protein
LKLTHQSFHHLALQNSSHPIMDRVIAKGEEHLAVPERGMSAYRAHSMTQPHKARQALRDAYEGKIDPLICYYCGVGNVPTARIIAQMGADMVWIDWEHASMGVETMTSVSSNLLPDVADCKLTD